MFTRVLGIAAGIFLAIVVTKAMNPEFSLETWLQSLSTLGG